MHTLTKQQKDSSSPPESMPPPPTTLPPKKAFLRAKLHHPVAVTPIAKPTTSQRTCYNCNTTDTRQWLRGDQRWLCHRCGQYWRKNRRHRPASYWFKPVLSRKKHTKTATDRSPSSPSSLRSPSSPRSPNSPQPPSSPSAPSSPPSPNSST